MSLFACFLDLRVSQPCKGERGAINIGNFRNKNKHNISPTIIPMPPVSLAFSTTSESINSSSSADPHRLKNKHSTFLAVSPPPQPKPPYPKSNTKAAAVLWPLCLKNVVFFKRKKLASITGNTWEALQCIRLHQKAPEDACRPFKVLTLARPKMFELIVLYEGVYGGT